VSIAIPLRVVCVGRDGSEGASHVVGSNPLEIGRGTALAFPNDPFISPRHCQISRQADGGLHLLDLGSRNGVYVRILAPEQVFPGDLFLLGHQLLRLDNLPGDSEERPPDMYGVRGFGTPLQPAWGMLVSLGVGDVEADRHYLRGNQVVFGREGGDILFPSDGFLSRQHARLRMELRGPAMEVLLEDLGSANGTYLRMRKEAVLGPGDMFRVGDQIFRVRSE
jgi:pSer/pThr/pTyr-binding forkhead associated (FHA) protein